MLMINDALAEKILPYHFVFHLLKAFNGAIFFESMTHSDHFLLCRKSWDIEFLRIPFLTNYAMSNEFYKSLLDILSTYSFPLSNILFEK